MNTDRPEDLQVCLDAVSEASKRVRFITFVIVTASVLVAVALWNSSQYSSASRRMEVARDAIYVASSSRDNPDALTGAPLPPARQAAAERFLADNASLARDQQALRDYMEVLSAEYFAKSVFIGVPFFGVHFDANDLGFVAGLTFSILLFMLQYSLLRKLYKLRVAFERASDLKMIVQFYQRSRIKRALALPNEDRDEVAWFLKYSPVSLVLLPLLLQIMIVARDLFLDPSVSEAGAGSRPLEVFSMSFLVVIGFFTFGCAKKSYQIEKEWLGRERSVRGLGDGVEGFEDDWWYSVVSQDGDPQHHGECTISRDESSYLRITGERLWTRGGKAGSGATWKTQWADITPGPTLRFEYFIIAPGEGAMISGYCVIDHMIGAPIEKMKGDYFKLPPATPPLNCTIVFSRKQQGETESPWAREIAGRTEA